MMAVLDSTTYISLKNTKWLYRGEGNANLVITIPEDKVIIRMEKCNYGVEMTREMITIREQKLKREVVFHMKVILPFLGKAYIQPPFLTSIQGDEIVELDRELFEKRPELRRSKGIRYEMVTVHPDYTYLPPVLVNDRKEKLILNGYFSSPKFNDTTYCIEIKPKQGWLYPSDRHHPKCTYCLNQYLKVKKKRVFRISQYCPLDLFSGNISRMKRAMKNLLITPQNNLKIFQNGKLVYSDECKEDVLKVLKEWFEPQENGKQLNDDRLLDKWSALLTEALTKQLSEEPPYELTFLDESHRPIKLNQDESSPLAGHVEPCDWSPSVLPSNCILHRILTIQKLPEVAFPVLYKIYRQMRDIEGDYCYVDRLLYSSKPPGSIERYLLSTTAKDCSIFIAFQRTTYFVENNLHYIKDCDGMSYLMNIGISDIDPKPLSCIEKHYNRDTDVVNAVLKHLEENA